MFIVTIQRSHERDLIGHILAREFNGMHVRLPTEYETNHPYVFAKGRPGCEVMRQTDSSNGRDGAPEDWRAVARLFARKASRFCRAASGLMS